MNHRNELGAYYQEHFKTGVGVEVGTQVGLNAEQILREWKGKLFCVDCWSQDSQYEESKARLGAERCIKGNSVEVAKTFEDDSLDFVFIDAGHRYEEVKADLNAWFPKVRKGGVISGHDYVKYQDFGVIEAVDEFCKEHDYIPSFTEQDWWTDPNVGAVNFISYYFEK